MADRHLRALNLLTHGATIDVPSSGSSSNNSNGTSSTNNNRIGSSSNNNVEPAQADATATLRQAAIRFQQAMSERMLFEQRQQQQYQQQQLQVQHQQQQLQVQHQQQQLQVQHQQQQLQVQHQQQQQQQHHQQQQQQQQQGYPVTPQQPRYAQHYSNYSAPYSPFTVGEPMPVNNYCSRQQAALLPTPPLYSGPYPDGRWMGHNHSRFSPYPQQQNPPLYGGMLPPAGQQLMPSSASHYPSTDYTHHYAQQQMPQQPPLNLEIYEQRQQQQRHNLRDLRQRRAYPRNSNSVKNSYSARYNPYGVSEHHFPQSQISLVESQRIQGQDRQQQMPLLPTDCSVVGAREVSSRCPPETLHAAALLADTLSDISDGNLDTSETDVINNEHQPGTMNANEIPIVARASFGQIHPQEPQQFTGCPTTSQPIINTSSDLYISEVYALSMEPVVSIRGFTQVTEEVEGECNDNDSDEMLVAYTPRVSSKGSESCSETENETESDSENESIQFMMDIKQEPIDDDYPDNETKPSNQILNDILAESSFQNNNHKTNTENNNNLSIKSTASPFNSICSKTEGSTSTQYPLSTISSASILSTNSSPTTTERCSPVQCSQISSASCASQQSQQQQQQQEKQQQTKQQQQQQTQNSYQQSNHNSSWSPFPSSPNNWIQRYGPTCDTPTREAESPLAVPVPPHNSPVDYQPSYLPFMPLTTAGAGAAAMPTSNPALLTKKSHTKDSDSMAQGKKLKRQTIEVKEEPKENIESLITPLPGFLQAFGSTEIGRFSETFLITPDTGLDSFAAYDENQQQNQQQQQQQKQLQCQQQQPQKPPQQQHQRNLHNQQQQHQQHFNYYAPPDVTSDHCGASQYVWPSYLDSYLDHANHRASVRDYHWRYGAGQHNFALGYGVHSASPSFSPSAATRYPLRNAMMMSRSNGSFNEIRCNGY